MSMIGRVPESRPPVSFVSTAALEPQSPSPSADSPLDSVAPSASPLDSVAPSTPPATATVPTAQAPSPWPALARANLLMTSAVVPGPVGAALDTQARAGLLDVLTRLDGQGVHMFQPGAQKGAPPVLLTPADALARIEAQPALFEAPLLAGGEQQKPWPLRHLVDLEVLDSLHLGGSVATGADPVLVGALRGLEQAGYTAWQSKQPVDLISAWHQASGAETPTVRLRAAGSGDADWAANAQSIYTLNFFRGSGSEDGLQDVPLAHSLQEFEKRGYAFRQGSNRTPFPAEDVYQVLQGGNEYESISLTRRDGSYLHMPLSLLRDPDAADRYVDEAESLLGVLSTLPESEGYPREHVVFSLLRDAASLSPQERAILATRVQPLLAALEKAPQPPPQGEKEERRDLLREAFSDLDRLKGLAGAGTDLETVLGDYCRLLQWVPREQALDHMTFAYDTLRRQSFDADEHRQLAGAWWHILDQVKNPDVARAALGLVQIPAGSESLDERVRLVDEIAARESDATLGSVASDYETVLANRLPGESLVDAGNRFAAILGGLAVGRQQERAGEVFGFIQKGAARQALAGRDADAATRAFLEKYVLTRDVDLSVEALRHPDATASAGQIDQGEGQVTIGGVRIPVRK